jgi:hypothetical protein
MLFGCLPPKWAAMGGLITALHYGFAEQWINSYRGGAFCAFGGALLFGALCRLRRSPTLTMSLLVGVGWSIVWLIRPLESLLLLMISWGILAILVMKDYPSWRKWFGPLILVLSIQILAGLITALHNRAVTGSLTTLPYNVSQQVYGVPQSLLPQKDIAEPSLRFTELKDMFLWQRSNKDWASAHPVRHLGHILHIAWRFFIGPWYSLPIVLLVLLAKDWQVALGAGIITTALGASILYPFFYPHYIAAYSCIISFLILRGLMRLKEWTFHGRPAGYAVMLFLTLGGSMAALRILPVKAILRMDHGAREVRLRDQVSDLLMSLGGQHVVFVRYSSNHIFQDEWVYNAADIDSSPIVWCRAIDSTSDTEVTRYYRDRHYWLADVDRHAVRVSSYQPETPPAGPTLYQGTQSSNWILESHTQ